MYRLVYLVRVGWWCRLHGVPFAGRSSRRLRDGAAGDETHRHRQEEGKERWRSDQTVPGALPFVLFLLLDCPAEIVKKC